MPQERPKVLLFILAHNEERSLPGVLREVLRLVDQCGPGWDVVVIDDGSTDGTAEVARGLGVRVIAHPVNLGIGAAEQTGLLYAKRGGYDAAVRLDGDGQHPPDCIGKLVEEVISGRADMAIGSRFVDGHTRGFRSSWPRRLGIRYFSMLCRLLTGVRITDPTSGLRCFGRRGIELSTTFPAPDFPEVESIVEFARSGLKVKEVRAEFRPRQDGVSSIGLLDAVYFMVKVTMAASVAMLRKKPHLCDLRRS